MFRVCLGQGREKIFGLGDLVERDGAEECGVGGRVAGAPEAFESQIISMLSRIEASTYRAKFALSKTEQAFVAVSHAVKRPAALAERRSSAFPELPYNIPAAAPPSR